jgi:hypothetical protein
MLPITYRPRFVFWTAFLRQLPLQLFLTLWSSLFFGGMLSAFRFLVVTASRNGTGPADIVRALLSGPASIGAIAFVAVPMITIGLKYLNYRNTLYTLDDRYVAVEEGFWTVQSKRILIEDVREVTLRRGLLQRASGVGSVYLASRVQGGSWGWRGSAMFGATSLFGSGVMLMDLPDWRKAYETMLKRVDESSSKRRGASS